MSGSDYKVGYGRPPEQHRFKPGRSGNPKGRPRGSLNLHTLVADELVKRVPVIIDGKTVWLTKGQLITRQQVNKAVQGDHRAATLVIKLQGSGEFRGAAEVHPLSLASDQTELTPEQLTEVLRSVARDHLPEGGS